MIKGTEELLLDVNDVLIPDLKSEDLHKNISDQFEVKYLSDSNQELNEVKGIMFSEANKLIGLMTMEIKRNIKNVYFLVDTGSPKTYICKEVLNSYNLTIANPNTSVKVSLNKRSIRVNLSPINNDINLLGTDFLDAHSAQLFADFDEGFFTIKFKDQTPEKAVVSTLQTSNLIVFAGSILIGLLIVILMNLFIRLCFSKLVQAKKRPTPITAIESGTKNIMQEEQKSKQK